MLHCGSRQCGSKQMQQIRMSLRGKAVVLMGMNTMMHKPSADIWKTTQLHHIRGTWALCSPRRTSLRSGTCCWPIRYQLLPVLVPLPRVKSWCQPRILVWGQRRLLLPGFRHHH
ncbi:unnamed protein product [Pipistrellus nathusii]|uniref:Uncharacterized protein n=1 Tax=Pipistrellus nathusii TaxID=59473 RepID=A0ABP0A313_PIPNA